MLADVAVDAPLEPGRTLTYLVPPGLSLSAGCAVWVPLGSRLAQGVVFELRQGPTEDLRPLAGLIDPALALQPHQLALARWTSDHYLAPLFESVSPMLPPGFRRRARPLFTATPEAAQEAPAELGKLARRTLDYLLEAHQAGLEEVKKALGPGCQQALKELVERGLVGQQWQWERPRTRPQMVPILKLAVPAAEALAALPRRSPRQAALLEHLAHDGPQPATLLRKEFGASTVAALLARGLVQQEYQQRQRDPLAAMTYAPPVQLTLTPAQAQAVAAISAALEGRASERAFLLRGVTGSGKTEVYLRALAHCLALGKRALVLVPEIALTPQYIQRLGSRFPGKLALLHSGLSPGEHYDTWWRVRRGDFPIVLGSRGAIFAPLSDLGLVVMDEEHEWTFKQSDASPRYHARDVALKLTALTGAALVLGSATPSLESTYLAQQGVFRHLLLPHRLAAGPDGRPKTIPLPQVDVVDMREELKAGNRSIFSHALAEALRSALDRGQQAILFLNRRGAAPFVLCRDCGLVLRCRSCDVTLTYHATLERLLCHHCGRQSAPPTSCPACGSAHIRYLGIGTQRVAEEAARTFGASVLRWDRDAARHRRAHEELMEQFASRRAQVLVGTQMIAKGLHLPNVSLVGVVLADIGLGLPDLRAGEHAFQLLCQVAGRAGRAEVPGRVILQTYSPDHYAVQAAAAQDYEAFYQKEMAYRQERLDPPFRRLARLLYQHTNESACQEAAGRLAGELRQKALAHGLSEADIIGPAPAFPSRVRGHYRWHIILRAPDPTVLLRDGPLPRGWTVDVDPVSLL
ncbi:MAG: primosomal protein N' [Chloroflexi bacterium]|nr:primosomal protein N' [Chloroflexota bacterium]